MTGNKSCKASRSRLRTGSYPVTYGESTLKSTCVQEVLFSVLFYAFAFRMFERINTQRAQALTVQFNVPPRVLLLALSGPPSGTKA